MSFFSWEIRVAYFLKAVNSEYFPLNFIFSLKYFNWFSSLIFCSWPVFLFRLFANIYTSTIYPNRDVIWGCLCATNLASECGWMKDKGWGSISHISTRYIFKHLNNKSVYFFLYHMYLTQSIFIITSTKNNINICWRTYGRYYWNR